jgi:3' terminal RNA ribose 2'-O-methyltransferase Hen1
MLLSITTTHEPATDLGFLLHKHPDNTRVVSLPFGRAHVLFPEAGEQRCTASLVVEVDPVALVRRNGRRDETFALAGYVNDRPYVASSFTSVALAKVFRTALSGRCEARPGLADTAIPLAVEVPALACRGGEAVLARLFEPLGYAVDATPLVLAGGVGTREDRPYLGVVLRAEVTVAALLRHLYVLLPVLDDDKHYWVGQDEVDKLMARGDDWLVTHPERELIVHRYLRRRRPLTTDALARLADADGAVGDEDDADEDEAPTERRPGLNRLRLDAVLAELAATGATRVLDLGCGEGRLVAELVKDRRLTRVTGVDVSHRALERAARRLRLGEPGGPAPERVALLHSGLTYRDRRLEGYDAALVVEVVEHLDPSRLDSFEEALFGWARPATVILTTPNREHNVRYPGLAAGGFRHRDHRFEWTRAELTAWAGTVASRRGYSVRIGSIGDNDREVGAPTQLAVFAR